MTEKTVNDIFNKNDYTDPGVLKTVVSVRQYAAKLGFSQQWTTAFVYKVVMLAKKEPKPKEEDLKTKWEDTIKGWKWNVWLKNIKFLLLTVCLLEKNNTFVLRWVKSMSPSEVTLAAFEARLRQMILQFQNLKEENKELYAMLEKSEEDNKRLSSQLDDVKRQFDTYKMAKMIEVSEGDVEATKAKLAKIIRDVNKCISILTE